MVNEDLHSTDLSVSDEEGHWTILLAPSLQFLVLIEDVIKQRWLRSRIALKMQYILHILSSEQKKFLFLRATFEQLSLQKATALIVIWAPLE